MTSLPTCARSSRALRSGFVDAASAPSYGFRCPLAPIHLHQRHRERQRRSPRRVYWSAERAPSRGFSCYVIALWGLAVRRLWPKGPHLVRKLRPAVSLGVESRGNISRCVSGRVKTHVSSLTTVYCMRCTAWLQLNNAEINNFSLNTFG